MSSSFSKDQTAEFEASLRRVKGDRGFLPDGDSFNLANELFARYATEIVITDGKKILLTQYEKPWKGRTDYWHIPGGFANNFSDGSTEETCNRVSRRELGVSVAVPENSDLGVYWWNPGEHDDPEARPLSVYTFAKPISKVRETDTCRYFPFDNLPSQMIGGAHQNFFNYLDVYLSVARLKGFIE